GVGLVAGGVLLSTLQPPFSAEAQSQPPTNRLIRTLETRRPVTSVAFSPDGRAVLSASADGLRLWEVATGKVLWAAQGEDDADYVVAFSPDGRTVLSCGHPSGPSGYMRPNSLARWDAATGKALNSFPLPKGRSQSRSRAMAALRCPATRTRHSS